MNSDGVSPHYDITIVHYYTIIESRVLLPLNIDHILMKLLHKIEAILEFLKKNENNAGN